MKRKYINVRFKIGVNPKVTDKQIQQWLNVILTDSFSEVIGEPTFHETTLTKKEESLYGLEEKLKWGT